MAGTYRMGAFFAAIQRFKKMWLSIDPKVRRNP
jgi:hypothetical protein